LFYYDTIYSLSTRPKIVHPPRSTELSAIFVGKLLTSLSAATRWRNCPPP